MDPDESSAPHLDFSQLSLDALRTHFQNRSIDADELRQLAADSRQGARQLAERLRREAELARQEKQRFNALCQHERKLWRGGMLRVAGVDEVGAGPLAGPVVAAAVIWPQDLFIAGIDDSKRLTASTRERLAKQIMEAVVAVGIGSCTAQEIDRLNIYQAGREAMRRAVLSLHPKPEHLLVDHRVVPGVDWPQTALPGGDRKSVAIAAASIVAKVNRDAQMVALAEHYPGYGLERHRGYGTEEHLRALSALGATPIHRRSFAPVARVIEATAARARA